MIQAETQRIHGRINKDIYVINNGSSDYIGIANEYIKISIDQEARTIEAIPKTKLTTGVADIEFNEENKELKLIYKDSTRKSITIPYVTESEFIALNHRVDEVESKIRVAYVDDDTLNL